MALVGPTSYVSTTEDFLSHWGEVNSALGAGNEVVVHKTVPRAGLLTLYNSLVTQRTHHAAKLNIEETSRAAIEIGKAAMILRVNQFNELVRADFAGSIWESALPLVPSQNDSAGVFIPPLDDANTLWQQINADLSGEEALLLLGDYAQTDFAADVAGLKSAFMAWRSAGVVAGIALQQRNAIQDSIQPILVGYRKKVPTKFPKGHPLVVTLPLVTPPPGSTPDGVTIVVVWEPIPQLAKVTFGASTSTDVLRYELRFCSGPTYDTNLESVVANIPPDAPREFLTAANLSAPGNVASFKVYVVTTTGNEKGSNAVSIVRP